MHSLKKILTEKIGHKYESSYYTLLKKENSISIYHLVLLEIMNLCIIG